jgi:hypothetical protein
MLTPRAVLGASRVARHLTRPPCVDREKRERRGYARGPIRPSEGHATQCGSGRLFRAGKAVISAELANIFDRLGSTADSWWSRLEKLSQGRLLGRYFAAKRERLREVARGLGVHHLANLGGCPAR